MEPTSSAAARHDKHNFTKCTENEFQWENLYLQRWKMCTYRQRTWRETYHMRLQCEAFPLLKWVSDPEFDNWHLTKLVEFARPHERARLVEAAVDLLRLCRCNVAMFCTAVATRDMQGHRVSDLSAYVPDPAQPHAVLLQHILAAVGGRFVRTLLQKFGAAWGAHESDKLVRGRRKSQGAARAAEMEQRDTAVVFLNTLGAAAGELPLEVWCCAVLPQKLHNEQVLRFLEVPGFDTRLISATGTKESENPLAREVTSNVLLKHLLLKWLQTVLRAPVDAGVLGAGDADAQLVKQAELIAASLAAALKPSEKSFMSAVLQTPSSGDRELGREHPSPGRSPGMTPPGARVPPAETNGGVDYEVAAALDAALRAVFELAPAELHAAMASAAGDVSEAALDSSAAYLQTILLREQRALTEALAGLGIHYVDDLVRRTRSVCVEMDPRAAGAARRAMRRRSRRQSSVASASAVSTASVGRASVASSAPLRLSLTVSDALHPPHRGRGVPTLRGAAGPRRSRQPASRSPSRLAAAATPTSAAAAPRTPLIPKSPVVSRTLLAPHSPTQPGAKAARPSLRRWETTD